MKHVIIGTAGHIDHGKTTLIGAITGRNTDRLKEEQKRGISIELGFTYFDLPSGQRAGIIDVPGHERFIKNMLAGVIGIDIVILVVAADESIMPQTVEHLSILDLLGIEKGFIVLTKCDLVEEEWIEMVEEEVKEEIKGTFLSQAPIIRASSTKKDGINEIINLIDEYTKELEDKDINDMPRLPVDRVFSMSGFGTIVTGTLLSGKLKIGDEVEVFPRGAKARIRTLQVHDQDAEIAYGGQRVAMNLAGIKKDQVDRGDTVAPVDSMIPTRLVDIKIKLIKNIDRYIENRTRIRLYIGSKEVLCRIIFLDKENLGPGEEAYAQLRLEEEIVAKRGDRFIVRFYSPMFTIGGGEVLETNPAKKTRFDEDSIRELEIKEMGSSKDIIENIIEHKSKDFPTIRELAASSSMLEENIKKEIEILDKENRLILFPLTQDLHIIHINYYNKLKDEIINNLNAFHEKFPLRSGMPKEEIRSKYFSKIKSRVVESFIDLLIEENHLKQELENISVKDFQVQMNELQKGIREDILGLFPEDSFQGPKRDEISTLVKEDKVEVEEVFISLLNNGQLIKLNEEIYLNKNACALAKDRLLEYMQEKDTITVSEFRDLLDINRRVSIAILEYFDQMKITKREDDIRVLYK